MMSIGHDSGPADGVTEIVGVQARRIARGRVDAPDARATSFATLRAPSADIAMIGTEPGGPHR
jgi:hypothetical protein